MVIDKPLLESFGCVVLQLKAEVKEMDNRILSPPALETVTDYEAAIEHCLTEIERLNEQMQKDQADIDRLKAETRAMLAKLKAA